MLDEVSIRPAVLSDAPLLNAALRRLSEALGDTFKASEAGIAAAGFGPDPVFSALLAETGDGVVGVAVYSPLYSTRRGEAGACVSDLWVDPDRRGDGLGARLLAAVRDHAQAQWQAGFLGLDVYDDNPRARQFYARLGFTASAGDIHMTLGGSALQAVAAGHKQP